MCIAGSFASDKGWYCVFLPPHLEKNSTQNQIGFSKQLSGINYGCFFFTTFRNRSKKLYKLLFWVLLNTCWYIFVSWKLFLLWTLNIQIAQKMCVEDQGSLFEFFLHILKTATLQACRLVKNVRLGRILKMVSFKLWILCRILSLSKVKKQIVLILSIEC